MALFVNGTLVGEDAWTPAPADAAIPADRPVIVGKARYLAEREALASRNAPLGLRIEAGEDLDGLEDDIARFALVVMRFPKYTDGRGYSIARLLRERHGFTGELRATGDVLRDQIPYMRRCGFDSFEITHEPTIRAFSEGRVRGVGHHYQPSAISEPKAGLRWRRLSA